MENKEWSKPGKQSLRKIRRRVKQSYYFFYKMKDGRFSAIERYGSIEKVNQVIERIKARKVVVVRTYISNSADFIKFLNRKTAVSLSNIADEAKMVRSTMSKLTDGKLNMSKHYAAKLSPVLNNYGWPTSVDELMRGCKDRVTGSVKKVKAQ